jgi:hypothetical protein
MASGAEVVLTENWETDLRLLLKHGHSMDRNVKLGNYFLNDPLVIQEVGQAAVGHVSADASMITLDSPQHKAFLKKWTAKYKGLFPG